MSTAQQRKVPIPQANIGFSGGLGNRKKRWDAGINWYQFPIDAYSTLRFFGPVHALQTHWIEHKKSRKRFPMICPCSNTLVETSPDACPIEKDFDPYNSDIEKIKQLASKTHAFATAIDRNTNQWVPVKIALSVYLEMQKKKGLNKCIIDGQTYEADLTDPYWGRDVNIFYDAQTNNPQQKYSLDLGPEVTPLTDLELSYLDQIHDWPNLIQFPTYNEIKEALTANGYYQIIHGALAPTVYAPPAQAQAQVRDQLRTQAPPPPLPTSGGFSAPIPGSQPAPEAAAASGHMPPPPSQPMQAAPPPPGQVPPAPTRRPPPPPANEAEAEVNLDDIPFSEASGATDEGASGADDRTWIVKGNPEGVTSEEFQKIILTFCNNAKVDRVRPAKVWEKGELQGFQVLQCYGFYRGDTKCVKCPLKQRCLYENDAE